MSNEATLVAHRRLGAGAPILLIHGLGASRVIWEPVIERLSEGHEVVALDLPGFGETPPSDAGSAPRALAGAAAELIESLELERPHVVGNSLGGWAALELAADGLVRSVLALSPAGLWRTRLKERRFDPRRAGRALRPLLAPALHTETGRRLLLRSFMHRPERLPPRAARALLGDYLSAPGYDEANAAMRGGRFERGAEIEVPVTIAWGEHDRLLRPPEPERLPAASRYLILPDVGHTPTWDDPDLIARTILESDALALAADEASARL